jgi:hypothetical protein
MMDGSSRVSKPHLAGTLGAPNSGVAIFTYDWGMIYPLVMTNIAIENADL